MASKRTCTVLGCDQPHEARGLCNMHYLRWRKHGDPLADNRPVRGVCEVDGCDRPSRALGLCTLHYQRQKHSGTTDPRVRERMPCQVDGCDRPHAARGWCEGHWRRWRLTGDPGGPIPTRGMPCQVDGCDRPGNAGRGLCGMHYQRWRKTGTVEARQRPNGAEHYSWRGDAIGYDAAHARVKARYGEADRLPCQMDGCDQMADDWAYKHGAPDERVTPEGMPYSPSPEWYWPLCNPCHMEYDGHPWTQAEQEAAELWATPLAELPKPETARRSGWPTRSQAS